MRGTADRCCGACKYHGVVDLKTMTCQRNPPAVVPLMMQDRLGQTQVQIRSFFPPVEATQLCGQFEPEDAK